MSYGKISLETKDEDSISSTVEGNGEKILQLVTTGFSGICEDCKEQFKGHLIKEKEYYINKYLDTVIEAKNTLERELDGVENNSNSIKENKVTRGDLADILRQARDYHINNTPHLRERLKRVRKLLEVASIEDDRSREFVTNVLLNDFACSPDQMRVKFKDMGVGSDVSDEEQKATLDAYEKAYTVHKDELEAIRKEFPSPNRDQKTT